MSWLLKENSPRPFTAAYLAHRCRAVIRYRMSELLPISAFIAGAVGAIVLTTQRYIAVPQDLNIWHRLAIVALYFAGIAGPPTVGTHALWRLVSARLYPFIDRHPPSQVSIAKGYRLPRLPTWSAPGVVLGETHSTRNYSGDGDYTLSYSVGPDYSPTPEWAALPADGLVTGLLVLGAIGSGKTADVIRPAVFGVFHHPSKVGGLVMDTKASLVEPLFEEMINAGRVADVIAIGPRQKWKWNPLHAPLLEPDAIAEQMMQVAENINGAPYNSDARWIRNGSSQLLEGLIGISRIVNGNYVTALLVVEIVRALNGATEGVDTPREVAMESLQALLLGRTLDTKTRNQYEYYAGLVADKFGEDAKFRGIYLSEVAALLLPLTRPQVADLFNAAEVDLDMPGWAECINTGLVVVLDCNGSNFPQLVVVLGTMLKLGYENAMLARLDWTRAGLVDGKRYMTLVIDEYQDFASPTDAEYLAKCRESKSITVFATQGYVSVLQKVGKERSDVLLQSLRNRLVLTQTEPEWASKMLGEAEVSDIDTSISETMQDAALHTTGQFAGQSSVAESYNIRRQRKSVVPPEMLATLPAGEGIFQGFDGRRALPLMRVFFRPHYAKAVRHADLVAWREKQTKGKS
jgi:hypothetical protein